MRSESQARYYKKISAELRDQGLCFSCRAKRDGKSKWFCQTCLDKERIYRRSRNIRLSEVKVCRTCCKPNDNDKYVNCTNCRSKLTAYSRQWKTDLKDEVFAAYGGPKCACCGEDTPKFLTLDHINNDGNVHRREIGRGSNRVGSCLLFKNLKDNNFPPGFQVLCYNCNMGKARNGGICPHKEKENA